MFEEELMNDIASIRKFGEQEDNRLNEMFNILLLKLLKKGIITYEESREIQESTLHTEFMKELKKNA